MLQIAICDDHKFELTIIRDMVTEFARQHTELKFNIHTFESGQDLLKSINENIKYKIYLLDIIMPDISGIELGRQIRERDQSAIIIYLSSSPDFALNAFRVYAFQYLLKPIDKNEFFRVLEKSLLKINQTNSDNFIIKTKNGLSSIKYRSIMYAEYFNHIIHFYLEDGSMLSSVTLRESFDKTISNLLQNICFVKPHKSYLVNMLYVSMLQEHDFVMADHKLIPISRNNYSSVKKQYIDFLLSSKDTREEHTSSRK